MFLKTKLYSLEIVIIFFKRVVFTPKIQLCQDRFLQVFLPPRKSWKKVFSRNKLHELFYNRVVDPLNKQKKVVYFPQIFFSEKNRNYFVKFLQQEFLRFFSLWMKAFFCNIKQINCSHSRQQKSCVASRKKKSQ